MITEINRVGDMVVQRVSKPDGSLVRWQYGKPGDAASFKQVSSIEEGRKAIAPLVAKTVDRNGESLVQKVTKNGVLVHYQYNVSENGQFVICRTLAEGRKAIGKVKENA